jgi:hypothetical protein
MSEQRSARSRPCLTDFCRSQNNEKIDLPNDGRGLLGMYCGDRFHARTGYDHYA